MLIRRIKLPSWKQNISIALTYLKQYLEGQRIDYVLIGAVALDAYGARRKTEDLDVLVTRLPSILFLEAYGFRKVKPPRIPMLETKHVATQVDVDILQVYNPIEHEVLERAKRGIVFGVEVFIPQRNDLIALKNFAAQIDPGQRAKALRDVKRLQSTKS